MEPDMSQSMDVWLVGQEVSPTQRRHRYVKESFAHPAKMLPALASRIVETYSARGGMVVDPMSGIGTTGVEAVWLGRRYLGIELESNFVDLQKKNLHLATTQGASGDWDLREGDARDSIGIKDVDLVCFSPPYQDAVHSQGNELARIKRKIDSGSASSELARRFGRWDSNRESAVAGTRPSGYSENGDNIGHRSAVGYWKAMDAVFRNCFEALRPGGYLAVVTKEQRDRKTGNLTNLYGDTVSHCINVGFVLHQHISAVLCKVGNDGLIVPRTSQWQRMAVKKAHGSDRVILLNQFEDVAIFRKPVAMRG